MKRLLFSLFVMFSLISLVSATELEVVVTENEILNIIGLDSPAKMTLDITNNNGKDDNFEIYSLVGVVIEPKDRFLIKNGQTKNLEISISPQKKILEEIRGYFVFDYEIKGLETGYYKDKLKIKIIDLEDAFFFDFGYINSTSEFFEFSIKNLENYDFENLEIKMESVFFEFSETINLAADEGKSFSVKLDANERKKLFAGTYDLDINLKYKESSSLKEEKLYYLENGGLVVVEDNSGFIVRKKTVTKFNKGNIITGAVISEKRDILTRLFTTYSENPESSNRKGIFVENVWEKELNPDESFSVVSRTNYIFPFFLLLMIVSVFFVSRLYSFKELALEKRVSYVRTKNGQFALKVKLHVKARKPMTDIKLIDSLPGMVKLYDKFGKAPDKIDKATRRLFWNINRLDKGEERVFSYIIYSQINVVGGFELPQAQSSFKLDDVTKRVFSNKTNFVMDTAED